MAAGCVVGRPVTTDSPAGGVQIFQQVTAHGGGQNFISGQTGGLTINALYAGKEPDGRGARPAGSWGGSTVIGARAIGGERGDETQGPLNSAGVDPRQQ